LKAREELEQLQGQAEQGRLQLCYLDESGFTINPPLQYCWSAVGQPRSIAPESHAKRVNVLGCLTYHGALQWGSFPRAIKSDDVVRMMDYWLAAADCETVLVLDNASVHHAEPMKQKEGEWKKKGLRLFYLPAYCPELNLIEVLWKQAKHHWRQFVTWKPQKLQQEVNLLFQQYGKKFTINFC
jgi:transposase